jgi:acyl-homoserine-lactone acylase
LRLYGEARCQSAEYWGGSRLFNDQFLLSAGVLSRAQSYYDRISPEAKSVYEAFANGINAYVSNHRSNIAEDALAVGKITGFDVVAYSVYSSLIFAADDLPNRISNWYQKLPGSVFTFDSAKDEEDWVYQLVQSNYRKSVSVEAGSWVKSSGVLGEQFKGSNAFASTRLGGGGILHINPHLSWIEPSQRLFESHTVVESEGVNFYGASILGLPFYFMGFNQYGGWAHTINQVTPYSLFEITLRHNQETDEDEYLYNDKWLPMEKTVHQLSVKNGGGTTFSTYSTVYGLVVARAEGRGLAFRFPGEDRTQVFEQYWGQVKAKNLEEFNQSASMMQVPLFTFVYTNRNGSLFYLSNSWTPNYRGGDYSTWTSGVYPITNDTYLWNVSDILPYESLPQLVNPESQFIQNANDAPWQATLPLYQPDPTLYANWMSPEPVTHSTTLQSYGFRARSQTRALVEARNTALANYIDEMVDDESPPKGYVGISYAAAVKISMSTQVESAKHLLKPLLSLLSGYSDSIYHAAYVALSAWDGTTLPNSAGAVLFTEWVREYLSRTPSYSTAFDATNPLDTPYGIDSSSSSAALSAINTVVSSLTNSGLSLNVTFGAVHLLPKDVNGVIWPANGECDPIGTVRASCAPLRGLRVQNVTAYAGCTWKAVIAFPPEGPIQAGVQLGYGIASQPGHKHNGDQWELFSKRQYRTPWINRTDIEANLESKITL